MAWGETVVALGKWALATTLPALSSLRALGFHRGQRGYGHRIMEAVMEAVMGTVLGVGMMEATGRWTYACLSPVRNPLGLTKQLQLQLQIRLRLRLRLPEVLSGLES